MKSTEGRIGRIFIIRLEEGDRLPDCIEAFALEQKIAAAQVIFLGGISSGNIVVGPRKTEEMPPQPVLYAVGEAHEALGAGLLVSGDGGKPMLHMHATMGRGGKAIMGCTRPGIFTWLTGEVMIFEIAGVVAQRKKDAASGFALLDVSQS